MSESEFVSATAPATAQQTPDNTTAPHEQKPGRTRLTPEARAAKIAAGINLPGPKPRGGRPMPTGPMPKAESLLLEHNEPDAPSPAEDILKALVEKLVALENNDQYRGVWLHFFNHGGTYNGPNYLEELRSACDYLNGVSVAKDTVG